MFDPKGHGKMWEQFHGKYLSITSQLTKYFHFFSFLNIFTSFVYIIKCRSLQSAMYTVRDRKGVVILGIFSHWHVSDGSVATSILAV